MNIDEKLFTLLNGFLENVEIEYHSLTSYEWSKGYRKAVQDIINAVKSSELER